MGAGSGAAVHEVSSCAAGGVPGDIHQTESGSHSLLQEHRGRHAHLPGVSSRSKRSNAIRIVEEGF